MAALRLYQPQRSMAGLAQLEGVLVAAWTEITVAPKVISWATLALGGPGWGRKYRSSAPAAAAFPAREEAALPVEEQAMTSAPASRALATAMALARSFRLAVG